MANELTKMDNNGENGTEKTNVQKALDKVQRGWNRFSTSKGGRWAIRIAKGALIGIGLKAAYDQGKKSVEPTVVMVQPVQEEETPAEEPATEEEPVAEEATNE